MSDNIELDAIEKEMSQKCDLISLSSLKVINQPFLEPFSTYHSTGWGFVVPGVVPMPQHSNIFFVVKKEKNEKKKFGRKRKSEKHLIFDSSIHNKFKSDNLLTKIQVNYLTFIVDFSNGLLKFMGINGKFSKINHSYKRVTNKKFITFLKGLNIGQVLLLDVSP